jgi:peptidoglycan hydrolase-like protein with peptidoglycan-binding domain
LKYFVFTLLLIGLTGTAFPSAPVAKAQTLSADELIKKIEELRTMVTSLEQQIQGISSLRQEIRFELNRFLQEGATGDDVKQLQEYLGLDSEIYPEGLITGFYGPLTSAAVKRFQERHGIDAIGIMGPLTRAKIQQLFDDGFLPDGEIPPGLTHAPGIQKKENRWCDIPGIAKRLPDICPTTGDDENAEDVEDVEDAEDAEDIEDAEDVEDAEDIEDVDEEDDENINKKEDITSPTISGLEVKSITDDSAWVYWNTNEDTDGIVYYSTQTPIDISSASSIEEADFCDEHHVKIKGLDGVTTYHVMVISKDGAGNSTTSSEIEFTTD